MKLLTKVKAFYKLECAKPNVLGPIYSYTHQIRTMPRTVLSTKDIAVSKIMRKTDSKHII